MSYDKCSKCRNDTIWGGLFVLWMLRPAWMVTGYMCGAVSCQAAEMGANVKKNPHYFKTPTAQRHVTILQLSRPHHFAVGLYGCFKPKVQVEATVNARSAASMTAVMNCVPKCVCVCCCGLKLQPQQEGRMTKWVCCWGSSRQPWGRERSEVGRWRKWSQGFEWEICVGRNVGNGLWGNKEKVIRLHFTIQTIPHRT